jgi:ornithine cyclodeaminase/alanine dehydrogenase-like protein (mu-crystallin family)
MLSESVLLLSGSDIRRLVQVRELIDEIAGAMVALSRRTANVPIPAIAETPDHNMLEAMPASVNGILSAKLIAVFPTNTRLGLESHHGVVVLFDHNTGQTLAVLDAGALTALRTAATTALATRLLCNPKSSVLAIVGAGVQGASHLSALSQINDYDEIRIASDIQEAAEHLASTHAKAFAADTVEAAVRGADVVCLCTSSRSPVIKSSWLSPGVHINSVGLGPEMDAEVIESGRVFVESRQRAYLPFPAGAHELWGLDPASGTELGEILDQMRSGRQRDDEITIYKSTGNAVEDAAAATVAYRNARAAGVGVPWNPTS